MTAGDAFLASSRSMEVTPRQGVFLDEGKKKMASLVVEGW